MTGVSLADELCFHGIFGDKIRVLGSCQKFTTETLDSPLRVSISFSESTCNICSVVGTLA